MATAAAPHAIASGQARPRWNMSAAPSNAPANIATTDPTRRTGRGFVPPASDESAARPVSVSVSTVVVRSAAPRRRTAELRSPMAAAVSPTTGQICPKEPLIGSPTAAAAPARRSVGGSRSDAAR